MSYKQLFAKVYDRVKNVGNKIYDAAKDISHKVNNVFHNIDQYYERAKALPVVGQAIDLVEATPVGREVSDAYRTIRSVARGINNVLQEGRDPIAV